VDVFLVPVGPQRHELYCEAVDPFAAAPADAPPTSWWRKQIDRFRATLHEAEQERVRGERGEAPERQGIGRWLIRKIAEAVAEQRLLWNLRNETAARLVHPDDMPPDAAMAELRAQLGADFAKHRRWCAIDAVITAITGPLFFFVPGPNVVSWYFLFRALGHYFAMRGAQQGMRDIVWEPAGSADLATIRQALTLDPDERRASVQRLSAALGLDHLAAFIERVAARSS
jgi:hypothetical protein